eukprot:TRINITY_DN75093_c0_g1_i1.p1 TRINITY_DN75093_c0_g1~~TRINITY_DN75093_c0_g1_i1.p1  ORF type:complete len:334 (+),score=56.06 TRINITY_DN75093_c0_g1_i1:46-1047(+)
MAAVGSLAVQGGAVYCLAYAGKVVIAGCEDGSIKLVEHREKRVLGELCHTPEAQPTAAVTQHKKGRGGGTSEVRALAAGGPSELVAAGSADETVRLWSVSTRQCASSIEVKGGGTIHSLLFHTNELYAGCWNGRIKVLDCERGIVSAELAGCVGGVYALVMAEGLMYSGSMDGVIRTWDPRKQGCVSELRGHTNSVLSLIQAPASGNGGSAICSGGAEGSIKLWDCRSPRQCLGDLVGHASSVFCLARVGGVLCSGSHDKTIRLWDCWAGRCVSTLTEHKGRVAALTAADGNLVSGSVDGTVKAWSVSGAALQMDGPSSGQQPAESGRTEQID